MKPVEEVLASLEGVTRSGEGWAAFCPAHEDTKGKSLTVTEAEDGRVLVHCHKHCPFSEIMEALGMEVKDAFPKPVRRQGSPKQRREYQIRDHAGRLTAIHHRDEGENGKKRVWWTTPDGKKGLGVLKTDSLPLWGAEAVSAVPKDVPIILCEGEKAACALNYRNIPAVATVTGAAGTPSLDSLKVLASHHVVLWPDADEEGQKHMRRVGKLLDQLNCMVSIYEWPEAPEKGDAADHPAILRGGGLEELREELKASPAFVAPYDPATDGAATFAYVVDDYVKLLEARMQNGGITGIRTGIPKVDKGIHGLNKGYSYIIAARPNVGKSLLAGQIALTAAEQGHRVLLQTPEMSAVQYLDRFGCRLAEVDYFRAQEGRISQEEKQAIIAAVNVVAMLPIEVDEYGSQPIERIRANIERHEPELVVVDYLQYLDPDDHRANRNSQVGQISRDLARLKGDYNIPVVIAAQLNRALENRGAESEPVLSDLRDSGELEQDADVVLMLHRPDRLDPDVEPEDEEVKILCRKNRMGQLWHAIVHFVPGQQWFIDQRKLVAGRAS